MMMMMMMIIIIIITKQSLSWPEQALGDAGV
jgi:hypothetical protein